MINKRKNNPHKSIKLTGFEFEKYGRIRAKQHWNLELFDCDVM